MDKYEFNIKVEQIKKLVNRGDYATAMKIADTIDWHRVRNANLLTMVAQVYEKNDEYQEAKDILLLAFERAPVGKRLLYKLAELALKDGSVAEFTYHNAHCVKIKVPEIGAAQAIYYDMAALHECCKYIKKHKIKNLSSCIKENFQPIIAYEVIFYD